MRGEMRRLTTQRPLAVAVTVLAVTGCGESTKSSDTEAAAPSATRETDRLRVPTEGMAPTLNLGQIVTAELAAYWSRAPAVGDIVVFNPPVGAQDERCGTSVPTGAACPRSLGGRDPSVKFIKRIVAGPGDKVA